MTKHQILRYKPTRMIEGVEMWNLEFTATKAEAKKVANIFREPSPGKRTRHKARIIKCRDGYNIYAK